MSLDLRFYGGKLSYLPAEDSNATMSSSDIDVSSIGDDVNIPSRPSTNLLVPLSSPVPTDWVTVEGEFISVYLTLTR